MTTNHKLNFPELGIGTWQWGDQMVWGFGQGYAAADLRAAFAAGLAAGITFFDTAEVYGLGRSEKFLGQFRREAQQPVQLATKFFPFPWRWTKGRLRHALQNSLRRLGVEQVDLYQIHWPMPLVAIETWMEALADAVQAGQARAVGVSNYSVEQTRRAHTALARRGVPLASNQVSFSLLDRQPEKTGLLEVCRELEVQVIAYSPLAMGLLAGKYTPAHPPAGLRGRRYGRRLAQMQPLVTLLRELGEQHGGKTPAQVALNWVISKGALPIPGAKNAKHVEASAGATGWRLTAAEMAALDEMSDKVTAG